MFSSLPMVAISRDLRKPGQTSMARPCFCLFADRLVLSSGVWTTCSSTPTHSPQANRPLIGGPHMGFEIDLVAASCAEKRS
jgi:hypothetical protein